MPVGWWLWSRRRVDHLAAAVGAAVVLWFASALPWGLGRVWQQSIAYNTGAGPHYAKLAQLRKLLVDAGEPRPAGGRRDRARARRDRRRVAAGRVTAGIASRQRTVRRDDVDRDRGVGGRDRARARARARALHATISPRSCRRSRILAAILDAHARGCSSSLLVVLMPWSAANLHVILWPTGYRGASAELMHSLNALPGERAGDQRRARVPLPRRPRAPRR